MDVHIKAMMRHLVYIYARIMNSSALICFYRKARYNLTLMMHLLLSSLMILFNKVFIEFSSPKRGLLFR
jgi:hypothetical protein